MEGPLLFLDSGDGNAREDVKGIVGVLPDNLKIF